MATDILDRELNRYGRPHNWADDVVDILVDVFDRHGFQMAQCLWDGIVQHVKPKQCDANVVLGRFRERVKEPRNAQ